MKKVHDEVIIEEDPTDIHHVELRPPPHARAAPPPVQAPVKHEESSFPWWTLLFLCCLPLLCIPCLLCQRTKKYQAQAISKPPREGAVNQKELIAKDPVYPRERPPEKAIVEETIVVRKEVPVEEYEIQKRSARRHTGYVEEGGYES